MVNPVVPLNTSFEVFSSPGRCTWSEFRSGYKQARPIDRVLPYTARHNFASGALGVKDARNIVYGNYDNQAFAETSAANAAYERFRASCYDTAGLGVDLAEYDQSVEMIVTRGRQLGSAFNAMRKGDIAGTARILKTSVLGPKGTRLRKSVANTWLEWHFGASPLISDVYDAIKVISNPLKTTTAYGSGYAPLLFKSIRTGDSVSGNLWTRRGEVSVHTGAQVIVSNPNLHLADQMGVLNPASLGWEIVPFSFLADWVINVGQCISAITDFAGLTMTMAYSTQRMKVTESYSTWDTRVHTPTDTLGTCVMNGCQVKRGVGISGPTLVMKRLDLPSTVHAVTSWALLVQQASKMKGS